jgi:hypothetical protein
MSKGLAAAFADILQSGDYLIDSQFVANIETGFEIVS